MLYHVQVLAKGEWRTVSVCETEAEARKEQAFYKSINDTEFVRVVAVNKY